jgi:hypothetical protein
VGGVHEDIKSLIKGSRLYGSSKSTTAEAMQWLQTNALHHLLG